MIVMQLDQVTHGSATLFHSSFDNLMFGMYHVQVNILYGHLRTYLKLEQPASLSRFFLHILPLTLLRSMGSVARGKY